ncbi:serine hydrolase [Skermania sp. ID1734]|uniref:serine hydrolase n=1 Tax=Skermania sp. ID1734 TaxID=2597516 RepID=UPI0011815C6F|nr:serine hydrolase [Skermania sp. ID1734]TSD97236.1 serine hydrolase [Skermania sp. ID1734]
MIFGRSLALGVLRITAAVGMCVVAAAPAVADPALPATPAGERAARVLQIIDSDQPPSVPETVAMSDPRLTAALWPQTLAGALTLWQLSGPFSTVSSESGPDQETVRLRTNRGLPADLTVHVDPVGLIDGITMRPAAPPVHNWGDVETALSAIGARHSLLVADGSCAATVSDNAQTVLPLGSTFKLYVLGALADAIKAGDVRWDELLTITPQVKSLPSGELQDRPDGSTVTVREAAEKMISISDNTAADLLIHRLGRARVEAQVARMGNHDPAQLIPFATTREFFVIGWGQPGLREQWRTADEAGRRRILAEADAAPLNVDPVALMRTPVAADHVGWFASAADLCRAHAYLQHAATGAAAPVRDILAINPGVHVDKAQFPYAAFKGGSSPGNLVGSWYLTDRAGRSHVVVFQIADNRPIGIVDENYVFEMIQEAFGLLSH